MTIGDLEFKLAKEEDRIKAYGLVIKDTEDFMCKLRLIEALGKYVVKKTDIETEIRELEILETIKEFDRLDQLHTKYGKLLKQGGISYRTKIEIMEEKKDSLKKFFCSTNYIPDSVIWRTNNNCRIKIMTYSSRNMNRSALDRFKELVDSDIDIKTVLVHPEDYEELKTAIKGVYTINICMNKYVTKGVYYGRKEWM